MRIEKLNHLLESLYASYSEAIGLRLDQMLAASRSQRTSETKEKPRANQRFMNYNYKITKFASLATLNISSFTHFYFASNKVQKIFFLQRLQIWQK